MKKPYLAAAAAATLLLIAKAAMLASGASVPAAETPSTETAAAMLAGGASVPAAETPLVETAAAPAVAPRAAEEALYSALEDKVDGRVLRLAAEGYDRVADRRKEMLVLADFSRPSDEKRLFVVDMKTGELLRETYVAHGRGSGDRIAVRFSNEPGSHCSSLGFYLTDTVYSGKNGYSLRLDGLEPGVNDKARERAIVMHGASYAEEGFIRSAGRLGRSLGCPALPAGESAEIIDLVCDGAVLFIYAPGYDGAGAIASAGTSSLVCGS